MQTFIWQRQRMGVEGRYSTNSIIWQPRMARMIGYAWSMTSVRTCWMKRKNKSVFLSICLEISANGEHVDCMCQSLPDKTRDGVQKSYLIVQSTRQSTPPTYEKAGVQIDYQYKTWWYCKGETVWMTMSSVIRCTTWRWMTRLAIKPLSQEETPCLRSSTTRRSFCDGKSQLCIDCASVFNPSHSKP